MTQLSLDLDGRLPVSAQIGMEQAEKNADPAWKAAFSACIFAVAQKLPELTVDDVIKEFERIHPDLRPHTHNQSAIGSMMRRAGGKDGFLTATKETKRSEIPGKHGNRHTIWASKYCRKAN